YLRVDPSDATKFQLKLRLRVFYPSRAASPNVVAGSVPLPVVVISHGNHEAWSPTGTATPRGTTETISASSGTVTLPVADIDAVPERRSLDGYHYLQKELAANGIVSASIDNNFANFMGSLIEARADLITAALDALLNENASAASKFKGRL